MSDYERLNRMTEEELRKFAHFAYTAYPSLLETHEIRQAFFAEYPEKNPYRSHETSNQMELPLE